MFTHYGKPCIIREDGNIGPQVTNKFQLLAELIERQQIERLKVDNLGCEANSLNARVSVVPGRKYTKINIGQSGRYMVDLEGRIWGTKGYGVINRGHYFGTLDTINEYSWGNYLAHKK